MSAGKLKNLIILILLLVCGFLSALVIPSRLEARRIDAENTQRLRRLMEEADVTLACDVPEALPLYAAERTDEEQPYLSVITVLLGKQVLSQQKAYRTEYRASGGVLRLNADNFTAELYDRAPAADPQAEAEQLLRQFGITHYDLRREDDGKRIRIFAVLSLCDAPLFLKEFCFTFEDGALCEVSGTPVTEDGIAVTGQRCCSAQDALIAFWGGRLSVGWVGSRIDDIVQGYLLADGTRLQPAWRIVTDTGEFFVDGLTKTVCSADSLS